MAKLHRRVPRLPHLLTAIAHVAVANVRRGTIRLALERRVILGCAATLLGMVVFVSVPAHAEQTSAEQNRLEALFTQLRSEEPQERQAAYDAILAQDSSALPAIRTRIARVVRHRPDADSAREVFNRIRHAAGSRRADDEVDIAPGVLAVLAEERSDRVMKMVEPLLLWRALERIGTFEAGRAMYPLIGLDEGLWRWEERRVVSRMGTAIMAAAIAGRNHSERAVRQWASETMRRLNADQPGLAVQGLEPERLADVLRAYAMLRMQSAMRVIASYIDSDKRVVRQAARWAIEQYGPNAIWVLRTEYHVKHGEHAPTSWGWRRVANALYAHADAKRLEPVRRAREAGLAALERGELASMRARFGEVLARAPEIDDPEPVAEGYATLAAQASSPGEKAWAYRRALRLAPEHPLAERWRAELAFIDVESGLADGVLDEEGLRAVVATIPDHEKAAPLLAQLEAPPPAPAEDRTVWAILGALIFALLGCALLCRRPQHNDLPVESTDEGPTISDADATLADTTLPG